MTWIQSWSSTWQRESDACWAIVDQSNRDIVVGRVSLRCIHLAAGIGEVTYWVLPAARGRGVAAIATDAMASWAFDDLGIHRLELHHSVRNSASCRVADKAHFRLEGTARSALLHVDGWHDMHHHARLVNDT